MDDKLSRTSMPTAFDLAELVALEYLLSPNSMSTNPNVFSLDEALDEWGEHLDEPILPLILDDPAIEAAEAAATVLVSASLEEEEKAEDEFKLVPISKRRSVHSERRKLCNVPDCVNQSRSGGKCKKHGGSKRCTVEKCTKSVQSRGFCIRHGGGTRCKEPFCDRASQSLGLCKIHGGGKLCSVEGCEKKAHLQRRCRKHGGGSRCSVVGCGKWAQRYGMCLNHSHEMSSSQFMDIVTL